MTHNHDLGWAVSRERRTIFAMQRSCSARYGHHLFLSDQIFGASASCLLPVSCQMSRYSRFQMSKHKAHKQHHPQSIRPYDHYRYGCPQNTKMISRRLIQDTLLKRRLSRFESAASRSLTSLATQSHLLLSANDHTPRRQVLLTAQHSHFTIGRRFKHASKMGHHLETLEEMAHQPEREAAVEKRKKKKERKAKKKKGKQAAAPPVVEEPEDDEDDFDFGDDDDMEEENEVIGEDGEVEITLPDPSDVKSRMMKVVGRFEESLKNIRGAQPGPEIFDDLMVDAYGSMTPLKAIGQVVIVSPTRAEITCFDPQVAKNAAKAVQLALELNPQVEEGGSIKIPLPRMSLEVREQMAKQLKKRSEACKQRIRQVRRKAMDKVKKGKDGKISGISKDDAFANGKEIESATESAMDSLKALVDKKMDSIMAI